ncbi:hypothetical protein ATCV1_z682R [Acanthocystis turfacea chlorella virus 1]|uniref:Uncharacterized protein z682R n=1 Tax=Chlorovirus heliozoae TaxID=322019 RepID=A7K9U2_9PHYC|nr:hypothetical protein ATCV1_z682R [Acanthocystis turfacea chlorella virus 1]ABT16816.1 hypothetical protein ATCV1_z682R [Acanthocystis turfacea chlorella virus 1]
MNNCRAHCVKEARVVGHNDGRHVRQALEVRDEPCHVADVHVVCRFVQKQDVSINEDGARERQLHFPAPGQGAD